MTKKDAMAIVFSCATKYKENLVGHSLLFLCQDKHKRIYFLEVTFDISNFLHLTGFKTMGSADDAYVDGNKKQRKKNQCCPFL